MNEGYEDEEQEWNILVISIIFPVSCELQYL